MSKPYEKLIDFCKAEVVSPTSKVAKVEDFGVGYTIRFPILHTSIDIYKPAEADRIDSAAVALYGIEQRYRDSDRFDPLCHMLGLNNPWIKTEASKEEPNHEEWVLVKWFGEYSLYQYDKTNGRWIDQDGDEVHAPFEWRRIDP